MLFQLISVNEEGKPVASFTEPMPDMWFAAQKQEEMGGYDPNGNLLQIVLI